MNDFALGFLPLVFMLITITVIVIITKNTTKKYIELEGKKNILFDE